MRMRIFLTRSRAFAFGAGFAKGVMVRIAGRFYRPNWDLSTNGLYKDRATNLAIPTYVDSVGLRGGVLNGVMGLLLAAACATVVSAQEVPKVLAPPNLKIP